MLLSSWRNVFWLLVLHHRKAGSQRMAMLDVGAWDKCHSCACLPPRQWGPQAWAEKERQHPGSTSETILQHVGFIWPRTASSYQRLDATQYLVSLVYMGPLLLPGPQFPKPYDSIFQWTAIIKGLFGSKFGKTEFCFFLTFFILPCERGSTLQESIMAKDTAQSEGFKDPLLARTTKLGSVGRAEGEKVKGQGDKERKDLQMPIHGWFRPPWTII